MALARLDARSEVDALAAAFSKIDQQQVHYELTQTTGVLAIALASLNAPMQPSIEQMLTHADNAWGAGVRFVNQLRYAQWVLTSNASAALDWLSDSTHRGGQPWAAAALADLNARHTLPSLEKLSSTPQASPALTHAVRRLRAQRSLPQPMQRLVFDLPLWHDHEPADEYPEVFSSILDTSLVEQQSAAKTEHAAAFFQALNALDLARVTELVRDADALRNARDARGLSPTHAALLAFDGMPETEKLAWVVIEALADVDSVDAEGNTPLHLAVTRAPLFVRLLLERQANVHALNRAGQTPAQTAQAHLEAHPHVRVRAIRQCLLMLSEHGA